MLLPAILVVMSPPFISIACSAPVVPQSKSSSGDDQPFHKPALVHTRRLPPAIYHRHSPTTPAMVCRGRNHLHQIHLGRLHLRHHSPRTTRLMVSLPN
ncbi:hypothetical protein B0H13DRAFT_2053494 [Mycena leptocephala]|nr:hypothetical protein B0H13DRAFT_2053494 [Mycena leptocephala]